MIPTVAAIIACVILYAAARYHCDRAANLQAQADYLAACLRQRRGNSAGWLMLAGLCREGRRMRVLDGAGGGP